MTDAPAPPPPNLRDVEWIRLGTVPKYLWAVYGIRKTRQTVYNWAEKGVTKRLGRIVRLRAEKRGATWYTKRRWVRAFVEATSAARPQE